MSRLTYEAAKAIVAAGLAKGAELGIPMSVAVVDESRELLAFGRQDGAALVSIDLAGVLVPAESRVAELTIVEEAPLEILATQQATPSALAAPIEPQADQPELAAAREPEASNVDTALRGVVRK